ncbi:hypothetical protein P7K49_027815 [Saguinus oedipus]|uniref:Uncharacterized protein n=1 Tax=Saguinus oedipus TaxID=9490 RepID=A0ABQ9UAK4_SAGOE|nr:hypothetical protein P7K49_027815 [Saguinus oedipus]
MTTRPLLRPPAPRARGSGSVRASVRGPSVRPSAATAAARSDRARARRTVGPHGRRLRTRSPGRHRRTGGRPARGSRWGRAGLGERADSPAAPAPTVARVTRGQPGRGAPIGKPAVSTAARAGHTPRTPKLAAGQEGPGGRGDSGRPGEGPPFEAAIGDARGSWSEGLALGGGTPAREARGAGDGSDCEARPPRGCRRRNLPRFPRRAPLWWTCWRRPQTPERPLSWLTGCGHRERLQTAPAVSVCCERPGDRTAEEEEESTREKQIDHLTAEKIGHTGHVFTDPRRVLGLRVQEQKAGARRALAGEARSIPGGHRPPASLSAPV